MSNTLTLPDLTPQEITELLAGTRTRGEYFITLDSFAKSGKMALDVSAAYPGKSAASLRNSITQNIDKNSAKNNWPKFKVMVAKSNTDDNESNEKCLVINMDLYDATIAEAAQQDATPPVE